MDLDYMRRGSGEDKGSLKSVFFKKKFNIFDQNFSSMDSVKMDVAPCKRVLKNLKTKPHIYI